MVVRIGQLTEEDGEDEAGVLTVLQAVELPAGVPHLGAGLAHVH